MPAHLWPFCINPDNLYILIAIINEDQIESWWDDLLLLDVHGLELLGQRFRGYIYYAVFCELALCQSNAPEVISIVLCSVVPGLCLDHPSESSIV